MSFINYYEHLSVGRHLVANRGNNAKITAGSLRHGWFKLDYNPKLLTVTASLFTNQNDAVGTELAISSAIAVASLPTTITLAEANSSGITATIDVDGIST